MPDITWDVWEEPNAVRGRPCNFWNRSLHQFYVTWNYAVRKIRRLRPGATIVGPSANSFHLTWGAHTYGDFFRTFLAQAQGNGTLPDVLSWHELDWQENGSKIEEHVSALKAYLASRRINITRFSVNEIVPASATNYPLPPYDTKPLPALNVAYLAALQRAGVESAMQACWDEPTAAAAPGACGRSNCNAGALDGLVGCGGGCGPCSMASVRAVWWVYAAFAQQIGGAALALTRGASSDADAVATAGTDGALRALIGFLGAQERDLSVRFTGLAEGASVAVEVQRISGATLWRRGVAPSTLEHTNRTVGRGGVLDFVLPAAPQDAFTIVVM